MKYLLILLMFFCLKSFSAIYYVSSSGSDSNSGLSTSLSWQTLSKVNSTTFSEGDQILFKRGDTFYGSINIKNPGASGNPIIFGAYGTGINPIITGFTDVTSWTNLGSNIWESTNAVSTLSTCNMVTVNGVNTEMGRYPNSSLSNGGFLTIASHPTSTSLTCSALTGTPDWTGAEIVIRENDWTFSKRTVTSQSGTTVNFNSSCGAPTGYGFFFQNDSRTLDVQNEWYYNPTTKKLRIYSTSQPSNVKVSTIENLIKFDYRSDWNWSYTSYITIDGLDFSGSNSETIWGWTHLMSGHTLDDILIKNCNISFCGSASVLFKANTVTIENCNITNSNGSAVDLSYSTNVLIKNNTIQNTGNFAGMGVGFSAISVGGSTDVILIEYNNIINSGHNAISFGSDNTTIRYNYIDTFNTITDDGGGIYGGSNATINNNIILNGIGAWKGTTNTSGGLVVGIYLDDNATNNTVSYNTISNIYWVGLYLHNANTNNVHHNIIYNNGVQLRTSDDNLGGDVYGNTISNNQFVSKTASQFVADFVSNQNNLTTIGTLTNNLYARPIDDNQTFNTTQPSTGTVYRTLSGWQTFSSQDISSRKSPFTITIAADFRFEYNETATPKTVILGENYRDIQTNSDHTSYVVPAYSSVILLKHAAYPSTSGRKSASYHQHPVLYHGKIVKL